MFGIQLSEQLEFCWRYIALDQKSQKRTKKRAQKMKIAQKKDSKKEKILKKRKMPLKKQNSTQ